MSTEERLLDESVERQVSVNGEPRRLVAASLERAMIELGYRLDTVGIALALNGRIVHREQWPSVVINDGDALDVVGAVQGG
jgi:sulfur carrier protein